MELPHLIDIIGIAAFSISGVFAAIEKKLDAFGIFIIAFVTALGGGTLRDILIGNTPVSWMYTTSYGATVRASTVAAMLFTNAFSNHHRILLAFDSLGLGFFTVVGIQKGIDLGLDPAVSIALGAITACFGGVLRDISLNNIPLIFQKEIYATACIAGGVIYFLLMNTGLPGTVLEVICIAVIVMLRLTAVKYNWRLPAIGKTTMPPS